MQHDGGGTPGGGAGGIVHAGGRVAPSDPLPFDPIAEARRNWEKHGWGAEAGLT